MESILIIDDEIQIRRLLDITLSANGYKIVEAVNGEDGCSLAVSFNPSLIILDLGLPDMDGIDVLKKLREWYQHPIIILSVRKSEDDIVKALQWR
jgi:two-component system KDP operon response regulator KdpE